MNAGTVVEVCALLVTVAVLRVAFVLGYRNLWRRFVALFVAVLAFELMCDPLWQTSLPHRWAFLFGDISWIMVLLYGSLYGLTMLVVDNGYRELSERQRFWSYLLVLLGLWIPVEAILVSIGVRTFPHLVTESSLSGANIPLTPLPIEGIFAMPVFSMLILGFYRYIRRVWTLETTGADVPGSFGSDQAHRTMRGVATCLGYLGIAITLLAAVQMGYGTVAAISNTGVTVHRLSETAFYIALPIVLILWKRSLWSKGAA